MCTSEESHDALLEEMKLIVEESILQIMKETGQTREQAEEILDERVRKMISSRIFRPTEG